MRLLSLFASMATAKAVHVNTQHAVQTNIQQGQKKDDKECCGENDDKTKPCCGTPPKTAPDASKHQVSQRTKQKLKRVKSAKHSDVPDKPADSEHSAQPAASPAADAGHKDGDADDKHKKFLVKMLTQMKVPEKYADGIDHELHAIVVIAGFIVFGLVAGLFYHRYSKKMLTPQKKMLCMENEGDPEKKPAGIGAYYSEAFVVGYIMKEGAGKFCKCPGQLIQEIINVIPDGCAFGMGAAVGHFIREPLGKITAFKTLNDQLPSTFLQTADKEGTGLGLIPERTVSKLDV